MFGMWGTYVFGVLIIYSPVGDVPTCADGMLIFVLYNYIWDEHYHYDQICLYQNKSSIKMSENWFVRVELSCTRKGLIGSVIRSFL